MCFFYETFHYKYLTFSCLSQIQNLEWQQHICGPLQNIPNIKYQLRKYWNRKWKRIGHSSACKPAISITHTSHISQGFSSESWDPNARTIPTAKSERIQAIRPAKSCPNPCGNICQQLFRSQGKQRKVLHISNKIIT